MKRLSEANKKNDKEEGVVSVTQQIFQNNDGFSFVNALVEQVIEKNKCG